VTFLVHDILRLYHFKSAARGFIRKKSVLCEVEVGMKVEEDLHCAAMPHNCDVRTHIPNGLD